MKYLKRITIGVLAVLMMFVTIDFGNQHFVEFGREVKAATVGEWTLVDETYQYIRKQETIATFEYDYSGTKAYVKLRCPITGGQNNTLMELNDLDYSAYEYKLVITVFDPVVETIFWTYNVNLIAAGSPQLSYGSADASWNKYYFKFYKMLKNQVPTLTSSTQGNETFSMA
ncbi:hypothetical protein [Ruminiclostridium cellobioparum]|uniref:hypothetical protein n=1 Tax=Ruminiclostridium cellobioparum TaxID=29355 RepID=UPI0028AC1FF1|nr:hypothetical protein [Ruminiclostridium cellobioparum]